MSVKIITYNSNDIQPPDAKGFLTLADNNCLPKLIADAFGWKAVLIAFTDKKGKSHTFGACKIGRKLVLLPHFSYGPVADSDTAREIIREVKAQGYFCEWRLTVKASEFTFTDKVTTLLPLHTDTNKQFEQLNANIRRKIRKCISNGIKIKMGKSELLNDFYEIYSRNMHRLGSPALPIRWFAKLLSHYCNGKAAIWCTFLNEKPVGVAFMLEYNGFYEACWFSTLREYNKLYTSYGLYWNMINYAIENDGLNFSFGRSTKGSGVHKYKQQWGGRDAPLVWNYSHQKTHNFRTLTYLPKLWKLLPYRIAKLAGPLISGKLY